MAAYFLRRLLLTIPTFLGVTLLIFSITRIVPGGPLERMLAEASMMQEGSAGGGMESGGSPLSQDQLDMMKEYYGFDKPIFISYAIWLKNLLILDLGTSTRYNEPVWNMIKEKIPVSTWFGLLTVFIMYFISVPLGIFKAINHKSVVDNLTSMVLFIGYAIPSYVIAIGLLFIFSSYLEWFPMGEMMSDDFDDFTMFEKAVDIVWHSVLPLLSYLAGTFTVMTFLMKNSMMDNLSSDYVRTAMAKGIPFKKAVVSHAMRNSLIPIATNFGSIITVIVGGSFLIEKIYNIDGVGLLSFESLVERDYPVVLGILSLQAMLFLFGNILSDFCVALVDPRVKFN